MSLRKLVLGCVFTSLVAFGAHAQATSTYRVGVIPTSIPFTYLDLSSNELKGAMIDMLAEMATSGGFKLDNQAMEFKALIPSLQSDKIDIMNAAVTITPARAEIVDFSEPLFPYSEALVVAKSDATSYASAKEFAGKAVGVMGGTTYFDYLKSVGGFSEIKTYDTIADVMKDIELGRIAAGFVDKPIIKYRLDQNMYPNVHEVTSYQSAIQGQVALAVKKGNAELLGKLNAEIAKLKQSGRLDAILAKWKLK